jgi:hypothetical protein
MKRDRQTRLLKKRSKKMMTKRAKRSKRSRSKLMRGGSYVGSIQGEFINDRGKQLFRNPVGGIA